MRRLIFCFLFLTAVAGAQTYIPSPSTPRLINEKGYISDSNPLPVASSGGSSEGVLASETIGLLDAIGDVKQAVEGLVVDTSAVVAAIEEQGVNASETILVDFLAAGNSILVSIWNRLGVIQDAVTPLDREVKVHLTQKITLAPNVAQTIISQLSGGLGQKTRLYVEVTAMEDNKEFWFNMGGYPAVIGETRRVVGGIGMELPRLTTFSLIASEAMDLFILEAGR